MNHTVLVLGGYGNFGQRICQTLLNEPDIDLVVAGRRAKEAQSFANQLGKPARAMVLDHQAADFATRLKALKPYIVIHTSGPFQGQDYHIAQACIDAGSHYLDLADGRDYVVGISQLHQAAQQANVLIVSGASSLPALSSAVVDHYQSSFSRLDSIDYGISSGAKPPGLATMQGVFSYVGKPFRRWQNGTWQQVFGWQNLQPQHYPEPIGRRYLANCDVPDLDLFPQRYPSVQSVQFKAGVGLSIGTLGTWIMSWLVRYGLLNNLAAYAVRLQRMAQQLEPLGSTWSAMHMELTGMDLQQHPLTQRWVLMAGDNHGPYIPCFPAIALTRKLLRQEVQQRGAMPCMGLLSVDEILTAIPHLNLHWQLLP